MFLQEGKEGLSNFNFKRETPMYTPLGTPMQLYCMEKYNRMSQEKKKNYTKIFKKANFEMTLFTTVSKDLQLLERRGVKIVFFN